MFIKIDRQETYGCRPDKNPSQYALHMCKALKTGTINEYLKWLEKKPKKKIAGILLGIICSRTADLPILSCEERPPVTIDGASFNPVQNIQARMITRITLLYLVESEARKLSIWDQVQPQWMEKYTQETKIYIQVIEAIIKQCENSAHQDRIPELRHSIELIKESNRQYRINW